MEDCLSKHVSYHPMVDDSGQCAFEGRLKSMLTSTIAWDGEWVGYKYSSLHLQHLRINGEELICSVPLFFPPLYVSGRLRLASLLVYIHQFLPRCGSEEHHEVRDTISPGRSVPLPDVSPSCPKRGFNCGFTPGRSTPGPGSRTEGPHSKCKLLKA
jgi:hypothetical protein